MDENTIKELWKESNKRLDEILTLNKIHTEEISKLKVQHFLSSLKPIKIFYAAGGIVWVGFGAWILSHLFIFAFNKVSLFFLFSASIQVGLTAIAEVIYIFQLVHIYQVDISESILKTQEQLARLKSSTLLVTRILLLQLPVWTTFYWNKSMLANGNLILWIIQGTITLTFTAAAVWLFFNIKYEKRNKKWFRIIFSGKEWDLVLASIELLDQIDEYKNLPVSIRNDQKENHSKRRG